MHTEFAGAIKDFWTTILHPSNCPTSNIHLNKIVFMGTSIYDVYSRKEEGLFKQPKEHKKLMFLHEKVAKGF